MTEIVSAHHATEASNGNSSRRFAWLLQAVVIESLPDLRVNKLTCLLSRSEPRDLVDLLFLDRAGCPHTILAEPLRHQPLGPG